MRQVCSDEHLYILWHEHSSTTSFTLCYPWIREASHGDSIQWNLWIGNTLEMQEQRQCRIWNIWKGDSMSVSEILWPRPLPSATATSKFDTLRPARARCSQAILATFEAWDLPRALLLPSCLVFTRTDTHKSWCARRRVKISQHHTPSFVTTGK